MIKTYFGYLLMEIMTLVGIIMLIKNRLYKILVEFLSQDVNIFCFDVPVGCIL